MGDEVTISYATTLADGTPLESLQSKGAFTYKLGAGAPFRGLDEAVASMRLG
ncbi:fkbp1 [Symbiodinium pilosum]|uniref:peptidylprolyl isomerase n=1 Tax=Symbiodinium pilosum TaxID=2952 RepID=A0A812SPT0_SYMPI|nr:fkbp1 [Symbiodinium pilosum]